MVQAAVTKTSVSSDHPSNYRAMAMVTTLFFMWGFLTALNDILVPHLKSIFELNYTRVMLINSAFFGSYFVFAIPAGKLIEIIGYKKTMVVGLLIWCGYWLFDTLSEMRRTQDCFLSGRTNCAPISVPHELR